MAGLPARGPYGPYRQIGARRALRRGHRSAPRGGPRLPLLLHARRAGGRPRGAGGRPPGPGYVGRCARLSSRGASRAPCRGPPAGHPLPHRHGRRRVRRHRARPRRPSTPSALGGDLVIVRSDGSPLYHFTVVVDDIAMDISHVIRGEDHLSNTPKHILLFRALGAEPPAFAHLPLILNPDRTKMSKRKSQTAVADYRAQGFVREAIVNHLALLGWSTGTDEEVFSLEDLVERFDLEPRPAQRRDLRRGAPRVAQRPVDPPPARRRARRARAALPRGRCRARPAGARVRTPTADDLASLLPMVVERLPRLDAIGPMLDFVFVDDLEVDPRSLVPKRWDAATTRAGLAGDARGHRAVGAVELRGRRAGAAPAGARRGARLEGGRPVHGHPRGGHGPHGHAAAVRHAGGHRLRTHARAPARGHRPTGRPAARGDRGCPCPR